MKLKDSNGRVLEDIEVSGRYPDQFIQRASYEDDGTEVPEEELDSIESDELGMWISLNY